MQADFNLARRTAADLDIFLVSQAGVHDETVLYLFLICGADTQPVLILVLCVSLVSQAGRRAGIVLLSMPTLWCRHTACMYTCTCS
jgi:hypothetical protein